MTSEAGYSPPPLHSVDHVFIHTDHAREMFALFRDAFGLPVAWPFGLYGTIQTGGLRAGNMNIEFGRFEGFDYLGTHLFGLGFAPAQPTWQMVQGLVARDILHTPPVTVRYREPIPIAFTNTFLGGLVDDDLKSPFWLGRRLGGDRWTCRALSAFSGWVANYRVAALSFNRQLGRAMIFVSEYHMNDRTEKLAALTSELQARQGGPFAIAGVGAVDLELVDTWENWSRLVDRPDIRAIPDCRFSVGPSLHFHCGRRNRLRGLCLKSGDLGRTRRALAAKGLLAESENGITVQPERVGGLSITFSTA